MQIVAKGITNLTDARYFAAVGASWMGFDLTPGSKVSLQEVMAIAEWVEGPRIFVDVRGLDENQITRIVVELEPHGLLHSGATNSIANFEGEQISFKSDLNNIKEEEEGIIAFDVSNDELDTLIGMTPEASEIWIATDLGSVDTAKLKKLPDKYALILSGGDELAIGVKDFDDLDRIIEELAEVD